MAFALSGAALRHLAREFDTRLAGTRLDNLYQLTPDTFLLRFRSRATGKVQLLLPVAGLPHLARATQSTPSAPSAAASLLRKRLRNARLEKVDQAGMDRILRFHFTRGEGASLLVAELFRQGNLVLVEEGRIIWVLSSREYRHRLLKTRQAYAYPPRGLDPSRLSHEELVQLILDSTTPLQETLARALNLGPQLAKELARGQEPAGPTRSQAEELAAKLTTLLSPEGCRPHLYLAEGKPVAAYPWPSALHKGLEARPIEELSQGYEALHLAAAAEQEQAPTPQEGQHSRRLDQQAAAIENYNLLAQKLEASASALYAHYGQAEQMLASLSRAVEEAGWEALARRTAELPGLVAVDPAKNQVTVKLENHEIVLDLQASLEANASRLYALAKRAAGKAQRAAEALERTRRAPPRRPQRSSEADEGAPKVFYFERFRWFVTSDGNIALAGRDAASNETVVRRYLKERDIFCHADLQGAPVVVVKHKQGEVSEAAAREGCLYSLAYSKAWGARIASGHAYWVAADQVSKTPQSGEFVAKGSFIIRGQRHWQRNLPVEAAVGWVKIEGVAKVMGGPTAALEGASTKYLTLRPGYLGKLETAKTVARALEAPQEALERVLPPGPSDLLRAHGCEVDWPENQ